MAYKKFEVANGTTYQEYLYTDGINHSNTITLTKQNYSPTVNPYTYYYTGSFELPFDNVSSVEIIDVEVGSGTLKAGDPITEFGYGGAYYDESDNSIYFYGGDDTLYPIGTGSLRLYAVGKVKYKVTLIGRELYGEIYDRLTINKEEMMPMSNTVEHNNIEIVPYDDVYIDYDSYSFGIYVDNRSNNFPLYITFDSGYFATSGGNYHMDDCDWSNQAIGAGESKCVWFCNPAEEITSADVFVTISAPGYQSKELELTV